MWHVSGPMRTALVAIALAGVLLVPATASARDTRCKPRPDEVVKARSAQAVVLDANGIRIIGCSRASGRRRTITRLRSSMEYGRFANIRLAGTRVAWLRDEADRNGPAIHTIFVDDAVRSGRRRRAAGVPSWVGWTGTRQDVAELAVSARGAVAWAVVEERQAQLFLSEHTSDVRRLDRGFALNHLRMSGAALSWRHAGAEMAQPLPLPASACGPRMTVGTATLDLWIGPEAVTVCRRADGRNATVAVTSAEVDLDGSRALIADVEPGDYDHGHLTLLDLDAQTQRRIDPPARPSSPIVTSSGLAWTVIAPRWDEPTQVWVEDHAGPRVVATAPSWSSTRLSADGDAIGWAGGATTVLLVG